MHPFAIVPLFCFVINTVIWTLVYAQPKLTKVNKAYLMLANCFVLWAFTDFVMLCSPPDLWAQIILKIDPILWGSIGFLSVNFAYALLDRRRGLFFYLTLAIVPAMIVLSLFTELFSTGLEMREWGLHAKPGPGLIPAVVITNVLPCSYAIGISAVARRFMPSEQKRRTLGLLIIGAPITLILGVFSEAVQPNLGTLPFPEFGPSLTIIMSFFVYRAVVRHNFLVVTVEEAAMDIFERAPLGMVVISSPERTAMANRAAQELLGLREGAVEPARIPILTTLMEVLGPTETEITLPEDVTGKEERVAAASTAPVTRGGEEVGMVILLRDVTAEHRARRSGRRLEEQLRQSQKMEAIGTLAGGVAHDMNNVLAGIMGFASVLESEMDAADPRMEDVREIMACAGRGKDLTSDLLGFARKGKYRKLRIDLHQAAAEVVPMLRRTVSKKIRIEHVMEEEALEIEGDPNQISHVIMNLCINAADAMPAGGTLTVRTDEIAFPSPERADTPDLPPGSYARLVVVDTGVGMSKEVADRAFEPFFTTKDQGKGTGLGLSMVYGTVTNHDGAVWIDSAPGQGTSITAVFPKLGNERRKSASPSAPPVDAASGSGLGRILLVDDEDLVRNSGRRMLVALGYEVTLAGNGVEAVEIFSRSPKSFDCVILDMAMPMMDGAETFSRLSEIDPQVKVIVSSGFALGDHTTSMLSKGARGFLPKPFDMPRLEDILKRTLGTSRDA